MRAIPVHSASNPDRTLVLIMASQQAFYGMVLWFEAEYEPAGGHWCAYLNVPDELKKTAFSLDSFDGHEISFKGVGSSLMDLPAGITHSIPIQMGNNWIGVDTMGLKEQLPASDIVTSLVDLVDSICVMQGESACQA